MGWIGCTRDFSSVLAGIDVLASTIKNNKKYHYKENVIKHDI